MLGTALQRGVLHDGSLFSFSRQEDVIGPSGAESPSNAHWFVNGASTGQTGGESVRTFSKNCLLVSKWRGQP